jgi:hypothetical protein
MLIIDRSLTCPYPAHLCDIVRAMRINSQASVRAMRIYSQALHDAL